MCATNLQYLNALVFILCPNAIDQRLIIGVWCYLSLGHYSALYGCKCHKIELKYVPQTPIVRTVVILSFWWNGNESHLYRYMACRCCRRSRKQVLTFGTGGTGYVVLQLLFSVFFEVLYRSVIDKMALVNEWQQSLRHCTFMYLFWLLYIVVYDFVFVCL